MSVGAGEAIRTSGTAWNLDIIMPYTLKKYFVLRYYIYEEAPLNFFYYMITKFYGGSHLFIKYIKINLEAMTKS